MDISRREQRRKERHKIYNSKEWKLIRDTVIREHPLCSDCLKQQKITPAEEVHHIVSFMKYPESDPRRKEYAYNKSNLVALCRTCHILRHHPELRLIDKYGSYEEDD